MPGSPTRTMVTSSVYGAFAAMAQKDFKLDEPVLADWAGAKIARTVPFQNMDACAAVALAGEDDPPVGQETVIVVAAMQFAGIDAPKPPGIRAPQMAAAIDQEPAVRMPVRRFDQPVATQQHPAGIAVQRENFQRRTPAAHSANGVSAGGFLPGRGGPMVQRRRPRMIRIAVNAKS